MLFVELTYCSHFWVFIIVCKVRQGESVIVPVNQIIIIITTPFHALSNCGAPMALCQVQNHSDCAGVTGKRPNGAVGDRPSSDVRRHLSKYTVDYVVHIQMSSVLAGVAWETAEERKCRKYSHLTTVIDFVQIATESTGFWPGYKLNFSIFSQEVGFSCYSWNITKFQKL